MDDDRFSNLQEQEEWSADILTEARSVTATEESGAIPTATGVLNPSTMSREEMESYLRQLTADIRVMKDELASISG